MSTAESASDTISRAADTAKTQVVDPARAAVGHAFHEGEEFARRQGEELEQWIKRQPLAAVGAAFGLGLLVSIFLRLKH